MISWFGLQEVCLSSEIYLKQRYGPPFKMDFLLLAPLRYGNIASSTKSIAYLKLAFSSRGIGLFLFM